MLRQRLAMWLSFVNKLTVRRSQITKRMCSTTLAPPSSLLTDYKNTDAKNQFYSSPVQVDLDLLTKFTPENLKVLRKDLSSRGVNCDLDKTLDYFYEWVKINPVRDQMVRQTKKIDREITHHQRNKDKNDSEERMQVLLQQLKDVRRQYKEIMLLWAPLEEKLMTAALKLPTNLCPQTPDEDRQLEIFAGCFSRTPSGISHVHVGMEMRQMKLSDVGPRVVYLLRDLAEMELNLQQFAARRLTQAGFTSIACPEIFRSVVVESCGLKCHDPGDIFLLDIKDMATFELNSYHLKGNSLLSYAAFLTKVQLRHWSLPLRLSSVGRHYRPGTAAHLPGLFGCTQSNRVTMFTACQLQEQMLDTHSQMVDVAWEAVKELGLPARKVLVSASRLSMAEGLRVELQVWSPSLQDYVLLGHCSVYNDYVSSRLMTRFTGSGRPLFTVYGQCMDTNVALGCILEHSFAEAWSRLQTLLELSAGRKA